MPVQESTVKVDQSGAGMSESSQNDVYRAGDKDRTACV